MGGGVEGAAEVEGLPGETCIPCEEELVLGGEDEGVGVGAVPGEGGEGIEVGGEGVFLPGGASVE